MQVQCSAYLYQVSVKQAVKAAVSGGSGQGREGSCSVLGFQGGARAFHEVRERRSGQPWYKGCLRHNLHPSSLILSPFQTTEGEGIEREVTARRAGQKVVIPPQFLPPPKKKIKTSSLKTNLPSPKNPGKPSPPAQRGELGLYAMLLYTASCCSSALQVPVHMHKPYVVKMPCADQHAEVS